MTGLRWGSATDTGLVRRNNQDNLLAGEDLFAVADGMGGHAGGEVASRVAIEALRVAFGEHSEDLPTPDDLIDAVHHANNAVYERAQAEPDLRGMGTTLTAAAVVLDEGEERIAVANVGDSRAYVFAHGDLTQLTEDHSVAEELARQGQISPDEVDRHPQRHILTRAMGILPDVDVDVWEVLPYSGDRLLLCSDGLVREVTDEQIASVLRRLADPAQAAQELVARARAAGGSDNITVVVIDVVDDGGKALTASEALADEPTSLRADDRATPAGGPSSGGQDGEEPEGSAPQATAPVGPVGAPGADAGGEATAAQATFPKRRRRLTLRVIVFVVVLLAVLGGAAVAVDAYGRGSYFVTLGPAGSAPPSPLAAGGARPLVIKKGRPGGLLWLRPTLAARTDVLSTEVLPSRLADLENGKQEPSLAAAQTYVANLVQEASRAAPPTTVTPPSTVVPSTTVAPTTTTTTHR